MHGDKANSLSKIVPNVTELGNLKCPICSELLKNPVELRCNHLFCVACIDRCENGSISGSRTTRYRSTLKRIPKPRREQEDGFRNLRAAYKDVKDSANINVLAMAANRNKRHRPFGTVCQLNKECAVKIINDLKKGRAEKKSRIGSDANHRRKMKVCQIASGEHNEVSTEQYVNKWIVNRSDVLYERPHLQKALIKPKAPSKYGNRIPPSYMSSSCTSTVGKTEKLHKLLTSSDTSSKKSAQKHFNSFEHNVNYAKCIEDNDRPENWKRKADFRNVQLSGYWNTVDRAAKSLKVVCTGMETSLRGAYTEDTVSHPEEIIEYPTETTSNHSFQITVRTDPIIGLLEDPKIITDQSVRKDGIRSEDVSKGTHDQKSSSNRDISSVTQLTRKPEDEIILSKCHKLFASFNDLNSHLSTFLLTNDTPCNQLTLVHKYLQHLQHKFSSMSIILNGNNTEPSDLAANQMTQTDKLAKLKTSIVQTSPVKISKSIRKKFSHQEVQINLAAAPSKRTVAQIQRANAMVSANLNYNGISVSEMNQLQADKSQNTDFFERTMKIEHTIKEVVNAYLKQVREVIAPVPKPKIHNPTADDFRTDIKMNSADVIAECQQIISDKQFHSLPNINNQKLVKTLSKPSEEISAPCKVEPKVSHQTKVKQRKAKRNLSVSTLYGVHSDSIYKDSGSYSSLLQTDQQCQKGIINVVQI